jgi:hypothetical protein
VEDRVEFLEIDSPRGIGALLPPERSDRDVECVDDRDMECVDRDIFSLLSPAAALVLGT